MRQTVLSGILLVTVLLLLAQAEAVGPPLPQHQQILDALFIEAGGSCGGRHAQPATSFVDRCGDVDGCIIRLVSDVSSDGRGSTRPVTLALNSTGTEWSLSVFSGFASVEGQVDGFDKLLLQVRSASDFVHCELWETEQITTGEMWFSVEMSCNPTEVPGSDNECVLRVDD